MDIFDEKTVTPMLIGEMRDAFDDPNCIYELKLDGVRCFAYLDKSGVELRNKRNLRVSPIYPELNNIHKQIQKRCLLDGELVVIGKDGKPDFAEMKRRALMSNDFKIKLAADKLPVSFVAFDILYLDQKLLIDLPLMERKTLLEKAVKESERMAISRYIERNGMQLYSLAEQQNLEGVVAKKKDSHYFFGKRTKDWIKIKNLQDDDFVLCGYMEKENNVVSLVLGQYRDNQMIYKGHVTMGVSRHDFKIIQAQKVIASSPFNPTPKGNENAIWIKPNLVCVVQWMPRKNGALNQPTFKGLRDDKAPVDCIEMDG